MNNKETFTPDEQKAISKYSWLNTFLILVNGIICFYVINTVKQGTYHLYLVTALLIISAVITVMTVVAYFRKNRHIAKYRKRYLIFTAFSVLISVFHFYVCKDYVIDIFSGEKTIITSEYNTLWDYFHTEIDGEEIRLNLTDETIKKLRDNEYIDSEEIYNLNTSTYYYKKKAHVTYYPHSKVVKEAFIEK